MVDVKKLIDFSLLRLNTSISVENELSVFSSISSPESSLKDTRFSDFSVYRHYLKEYYMIHKQ